MQESNLSTLRRHPIIDEDARFFERNKKRKYRLRPYFKGEFNWDEGITLFRGDENGSEGANELGEINTIVVRQAYPGCRFRMPFYCLALPTACSDEAIIRLLKKWGFGKDLKPLNK